MSELVSTAVADRVATVTIHSPTMPPQFFTDLGDRFRALHDDADVRCVILRSDAKAFTYGLDLMQAFQAHGPLLTGPGLAGPRSELRRLIVRWQADVTAIADCPVPVIAAIHGWCIGGGVDVITACDIRLASADAKLSVRETKMAIVADLGTLQRLPRLIGQGQARELAFTGRDVTADEAHRIGLVNRVLETREALDDAARALAAEIAANAPLTVRGTKHVLNACADRTIAEGLEYVATWNSAFLASEDLGEAVAAFTQRRDPNYKGR